MSQEIERKFLIRELPNLDGKPWLHIEQGYLCLGDKEEVRLRSAALRDCDPIHTLTVKKGSGLVRGEEEIKLDKQQFDLLWPMTKDRRITKRRYDYWTSNDTEDIEIDIYEGALEGLLIAEIEFENEEQAKSYQPPTWIGEDVTNDDRYKNRSLAVLPLVNRQQVDNWSVTADMANHRTPDYNEMWGSSLNQRYIEDKLADVPEWRKDKQ